MKAARLLSLLAMTLLVCGQASAPRTFDKALILAVDVSGSVDAARYRVQMEGIARALEDPAVIRSMLSGENRTMAIAMLAWSDKTEVAVPWQVVTGPQDARRVAGMIRALPRISGEFTCMARMLREAREGLVREVPGEANALVIDVSGDGPDNCAGVRATEEARDKLVAQGITINGLPIRTENEMIGTGAYRAPGFGWEELKREPHAQGVTIEGWYEQHVMGGPNAFIVVADGYQDFERAFRRKFLSEIAHHPNGKASPRVTAGRR